ncbi:gluconate 2-dehydrogenase subunit 3 family protein [Duganella callida]|uniref:Gluconate 2-dehydrogenase subunit 3 family protein n=1 Tax=Duganella callida TaxID=2561932 RepID=A0A4Y9SDZ3_9BURK|nr:gluconate 2-dehydrogenase subunit 3 family protein [Duganella callida]TFW18116.1 gluconate 2-dehydrogenase subunit 3 family protein [Duganella callida]
MLHTEREAHGRRAALIKLAALTGVAISGDALAALAQASDPSMAPGLLNGDALALTGVLVDHIIPATDTPGALAVGAHRTISHLLLACGTEAQQRDFLAGLARLDAQAGQRFAALPASRQVALLHALDDGKAPFGAQDQRFFRQLKSYTLFAYYTSEAGATRELAYLPVPGGFKGNVPVRDTTRTWAI